MLSGLAPRRQHEKKIGEASKLLLVCMVLNQKAKYQTRNLSAEQKREMKALVPLIEAAQMYELQWLARAYGMSQLKVSYVRSDGEIVDRPFKIDPEDE